MSQRHGVPVVCKNTITEYVVINSHGTVLTRTIGRITAEHFCDEWELPHDYIVPVAPENVPFPEDTRAHTPPANVGPIPLPQR
jgi:hypothetical protein